MAAPKGGKKVIRRRRERKNIEKGAAQDNDVLANKIVQIHNLLKANIPPDALESYLRRSH